MLVECGFVRATAADGSEWTFTPAIGRIASLGTPREIVACYGALHGPQAGQEAAYVLACLCDQDGAAELTGTWEPVAGSVALEGYERRHTPGLMPVAEQIIIARHLMQHGIIGQARPGERKAGARGKFSEEFHAAEYVAAACVHLGLTRAEAEALSMTEFQQMLEMKFPEQAKKAASIPTREEYAEVMRKFHALNEREKEGAANG